MQVKCKNNVFFITITAIVFFIIAVFCNNYIAFASACDFTIVVGSKTYSFSSSELGRYKDKTYLKCAEGVVDGIYYDTLIEPCNASVKFNPLSNEMFIIEKEKVGYQIDREKLLSDIDSSLNSNVKTLKVSLNKVMPKITYQTIKNSTYETASFSTYYGDSQPSRKHNIKLAVEKINGCVLGSGETFSFNQVVGDRTEENGFQSSKVIENGVYVDGVGGGVCQVSTTLYNAALLSGLEIIERHQHSVMASYIEPSFDAMVSGNYSDFKFKNNTSGFVFIKGVCDGKNVAFTFYGLKPKYSYKRASKVIETYEPSGYEIIFDETLKAGERVYSRFSKNGVKSEGYLQVYDNKGLIREKRLSVDKYKSVKGEIRVGTGKS